MGVWSSDIINGDSTLEVAMDFLHVAGIGPKVWPPKIMAVNMMMVEGLGPIITRHAQYMYAEYYECLHNVAISNDAHEALEANLPALLRIAMEKQTILDKHTYGVNRGEDSPVGHAVQVLTLLLMLAGAYLPANFKELVAPLNANDPFSHHPDDPLRPLIMKGFMAMIDEYAVVGTCDAIPTLDPDSVEHKDVGVEYITVVRMDLDCGQHPMIWQGEPDDEPWRMGIESRYTEGLERTSMTRKRPIKPMRLSGAPTAEELARMHAKAVKDVPLPHRHGRNIPSYRPVDPAATGDLTHKAVRIVGLVARPDLNGRLGVAFSLSLDTAGGRYEVCLIGTSPNPADWPQEPIRVRPANLEELDAPNEEAKEEAKEEAAKEECKEERAAKGKQEDAKDGEKAKASLDLS